MPGCGSLASQHLNVVTTGDRRQRHLCLNASSQQVGNDLSCQDVCQFTDNVSHVRAVERNFESRELERHRNRGLLWNDQCQRPWLRPEE